MAPEAGWASAREPYGAQHWASYEVLDDQTFVTVTTAPDTIKLGTCHGRTGPR